MDLKPEKTKAKGTWGRLLLLLTNAVQVSAPVGLDEPRPVALLLYLERTTAPLGGCTSFQDGGVNSDRPLKWYIAYYN